MQRGLETMHDDLADQLENLRRRMRGTGHTYEDVAIDACREIIMSKAATMFINEALSAREVLRETAQPLLPAPAPLQHQPHYDYVPPIDQRTHENNPNNWPRVANDWPHQRTRVA